MSWLPGPRRGNPHPLDPITLRASHNQPLPQSLGQQKSTTDATRAPKSTSAWEGPAESLQLASQAWEEFQLASCMTLVTLLKLSLSFSCLLCKMEKSFGNQQVKNIYKVLGTEQDSENSCICPMQLQCFFTFWGSEDPWGI